MKKLIIVLCFLFFETQLFGQVSFQNPSFENFYAGPDTLPYPWTICLGTPDVLPIGGYPWYLPAYDGKYYVDIGANGTASSDTTRESFGEELSCNLIKNRHVHFSCYVYSVSYYGLFGLGCLQVWGGNSQCSQEELLWQSNGIDTIWNKINVDVLPSNNYNFIEFRVIEIHPSQFGAKVGIDDLSEITVDGYNFLSTNFSDTILKKDSCVTIVASSDDTTATFSWGSLPAGFTDIGKSVTVCPMVNTQYICTATYGCGMQKSDTVNVEVTPNGVENIKGGEYLSIYPNPATNLLQLSNLPTQTSALQYSIINTLWQVKQSSTLAPGNTSAGINVSTLPVGVYFIRLTGSKGVVYSGKFVKE